MIKLVTIDFHNTLFHCDEWFRLEIEELPIAALRLLSPDSSVDLSIERESRARSAYLELRSEAMRTGVECDAVSGVARVFEQLDLSTPYHQIDEAVEHIMKGAVDQARPIDGAVDLLRAIRKRGIPAAVVSSAAYHPFLIWCIERYDLTEELSRVVTSASCGIYKSDPAIYRYTVNLFDVSPAQSVHIGDSHRFDVTSAGSIGMRTIMLSDELATSLDPAPDALVRTLGEARQYLDTLLAK